MNDEQKAKEILDYCIDYLEHVDGKPDSRLYREMLKEIEFMLTTD